MMRKNNTMIAVVALLLVVGGVLYMNTTREPAQVACTMEAKLCPDGSYVGRSGPKCEFAACPVPVTLTTTYIHAVEWPPKLQVVDAPFTCAEPHVTRGRSYCITKVNEGAAGSTYTQYAYSFARGGKTNILTFTLRAVQCGNYNDPEKTACESERASFDLDLDNIIDQIAQGTQ